MFAAFAAAALFASPAQAAPVTYAMTFFDEAGVQVGTGTLVRFPDLAGPLFVDGEAGGLCLDISDSCVNAGTVQPVSIEATLFGDGFFPAADLYDILSHVWDPRSAHAGFLDPESWYLSTALGEISLILGLGDLAAAVFFAPFDYGEGTATGTVRFDLVATPLPAAALLFLAGLAGLRLRRRA